MAIGEDFLLRKIDTLYLLLRKIYIKIFCDIMSTFLPSGVKEKGSEGKGMEWKGREWKGREGKDTGYT